MVKLSELKKLEKNAELDLQQCRIIQQDISYSGHTQYILEKDGRFFYREELNGTVICCYEMAVDWKPFGKYTVYTFTPDDLHIYQVEAGRKRMGDFNILQMDLDLIQPGMSCQYYGNVLEYIDETHISFDGHPVPVEAESDYVFKASNRKIKAKNGAKGLYCFLELVAEESKHKQPPFWSTAWWRLFNLYAPQKG